MKKESLKSWAERDAENGAAEKAVARKAAAQRATAKKAWAIHARTPTTADIARGSNLKRAQADANVASRKAEKEGTQEAHEKAAEAHRVASGIARAEGYENKALGHADKRFEHADQAKRAANAKFEADKVANKPNVDAYNQKAARAETASKSASFASQGASTGRNDHQTAMMRHDEASFHHEKAAAAATAAGMHQEAQKHTFAAEDHARMKTEHADRHEKAQAEAAKGPDTSARTGPAGTHTNTLGGLAKAAMASKGSGGDDMPRDEQGRFASK